MLRILNLQRGTQGAQGPKSNTVYNSLTYLTRLRRLTVSELLIKRAMTALG